jgi:hypothetical protein
VYRVLVELILAETIKLGKQKLLAHIKKNKRQITSAHETGCSATPSILLIVFQGVLREIKASSLFLFGCNF